MVKFNCHKQRQNVVFNRKNLKDKSPDPKRFLFSGKRFLNDRMSHENHQLAYGRRQLKTTGTIPPHGFLTTL